jgi:hypothetical protein
MQMKFFGITNVDFDVIGGLIRVSLSIIQEKKWEYNGTVHQLLIDFKKACFVFLPAVLECKD